MSNIKKAAQEQGIFFYGDEIVNYDIIRRVETLKNERPKANKVVIKVHPDQQVVAIAPESASAEDIQNAMLKRARWIFESLTSFSSQHEYVMARQYVSGETQFYLGRRYVLKVMIDASQPPCVKLYRGKLTVSLKKDSAHRAREVKALLDHWYASHARTVFHTRLCELLPKATWTVGMPSYRIMPMKKQWGSCSKKGRLMLNPHLVKAPKECIDYVILHELCHIAVHNHSDKFWKLLTQVMPNWKAVKAKLDGMAELYLNE